MDNEPNNYSKACIPPLITTTNGQQRTTASNTEKAAALASTFFPPPPPSNLIPETQHPQPLKGVKLFTRNAIKEAISKLHPHKAPGPDRIPNIVLMKCIDVLIDHLYFLYRAILELEIYPSRWLLSTTIVLRKPGKTAYDVPKAYRPIGLLDTLG